jgi:hypothetical protein
MDRHDKFRKPSKVEHLRLKVIRLQPFLSKKLVVVQAISQGPVHMEILRNGSQMLSFIAGIKYVFYYQYLRVKKHASFIRNVLLFVTQLSSSWVITCITKTIFSACLTFRIPESVEYIHIYIFINPC